MAPTEESWFANSDDAGPTLEDFLATDPSQLPFLQERPTTAEDSMRYQLFADEWSSIENLQQLRHSVLHLVDSLTAGFIWHREPFALSVAIPPEGELEPHLVGDQIVGASVSDEWLVCYLIFTITSTFSGLTACVTDNDGELLLIEAATALPPFLSPANSNHRVWVRSGEVHLVMPGCMVDRARTPRTLGAGNISLLEGLKAVREGDGGTVADEGVQRPIRQRIEGYPEKAKANMHHARCFLPVAAALAFRDTPGLVAAAVHAYCSGDPADKKHGVRMSRLLPAATNDSRNGADANAGERSPPISPRFVETRIAFTRHLYAQLHQAAVASSKAFPQGWAPSDRGLSPALYAKAAQLGQKLSMGLEAAYQACADRYTNKDSGDLLSAVRSETWRKFMSGLERNGFFEGEMEGSKRYREKTAMAEQFVRDSIFHISEDSATEENTAGHVESRQCPVHEVVDRSIEGGVDRGHVFEPPTEQDDKEDWMEVSQADLDEMLKSYGRAGAESGPLAGEQVGGNLEYIVDGDGETASSSSRSAEAVCSEGDVRTAQDGQAGFENAVDELDDIVEGMNTFVDDSRAGLEGAEVEHVRGDVHFDVDKFMSLLSGEDLMSALDDAADEDGYDDLHGSDDDLLESSDEECDEEDLDEKPQRMPEPVLSKPAGPKAPSSPGSANKGASSDTREGFSGAGQVGGDRKSHIPKRNGIRPTVAFEMQEMERRRSEGGSASAGDGNDTDQERDKGGGEAKGEPGSKDELLKEYMAAMEVELGKSSMGHSFEKLGESISEAQMEELQTMGPLDQNGDLAPEEWLRSDDSSKPSAGAEADDPADPSEETAADYRPVDVDMNLVKHLLESTASQGGLSGPASNLLRSMGLNFPSIPPGSGAGKNDAKTEEL